MGSFGELVKELRGSKGWSQDKLAQVLEMSKGRINAIEQMEAPNVFPSTMAKIASAFEMDIAALRQRYEQKRRIDFSPEERLSIVITNGDEPGERVSREVIEQLLAEAEASGVNVMEVASRWLQANAPGKTAVITQIVSVIKPVNGDDTPHRTSDATPPKKPKPKK